MIKTRKWQDRDGKARWSTEIVIGRFDGRLSLEGQPAISAADAFGAIAAQTKPHPDYEPPLLWSQTSKALTELTRAVKGQWPPARKENPSNPDKEAA